MQKLPKQFFSYMKKDIEKSPYRNSIVSIVAIGSSVTGEFIKGKSDLDMGIVVKTRKDKKIIDRYFTNLIGKIDKKYGLNLKRKEKMDFMDGVWGTIFGGTIRYYRTHAMIVSLDDIDFINQKINDTKLMFFVNIATSFNLFLREMKYSSFIIYGKDIRRMIKPRSLDFYDTTKLFFNAFLFWLMSISNFLDARESIRNAAKACIFESEHELAEMQIRIGSRKENIKDWKKFVNDKQFSDHLSKALYYKKHPQKITRQEQASFIANSIKFLVGTHLMLFKRRLFKYSHEGRHL